MRGTMMAAAVLLGVLCYGTSASAGIYTDDLSRCLVKSASEDDKTVLMKWVFGLMSASPAVGPMVSITPEQRKALNKQGAALFERLIITDCHKEAVAAIKFEGDNALETSFGVLGQVAVRGLMTAPAVNAELETFASYFDKDKLKALGEEADPTGTPAPASPAHP